MRAGDVLRVGILGLFILGRSTLSSRAGRTEDQRNAVLEGSEDAILKEARGAAERSASPRTTMMESEERARQPANVDGARGAREEDAPADTAEAGGDRAAEQPDPAPASSPGEPPADREGFRPRHPKALSLSMIAGAVVTAITAVATFTPMTVVSALEEFDQPETAIRLAMASLITLIVAFFLLVLPRWRHRRYRYRVDDDGLEIHRGVWWRSRVHVARSRVQHTDVAQGPLERPLGLASLIVHTAGTHDSSIRLSGLAFATALEVRQELTGNPGEATDGV